VIRPRAAKWEEAAPSAFRSETGPQPLLTYKDFPYTITEAGIVDYATLGTGTSVTVRTDEDPVLPSRPAGRCSQCGAPLADGECDRLFHEVGMRLQDDLTLLAFRTQLVDAYCCQHEPYIRSAKSFAAHLAGLCLSLEHGQSGPGASVLISRWLNGRGPQGLSRPDVPIPRAAVTIADVAGAKSAAELQVLVRQFAESVWAAWTSQHDLARHWTLAARRTT
jgi:hypothetical protein